MILGATPSKEQRSFRLYSSVESRLFTLACWMRATLLTKGHRLCGNDWILQQDNAEIHNTHKTKNFAIANNVIILDHPLYSSDLNSTENILESITRMSGGYIHLFLVHPLYKING